MTKATEVVITVLIIIATGIVCFYLGSFYKGEKIYQHLIERTMG